MTPLIMLVLVAAFVVTVGAWLVVLPEPPRKEHRASVSRSASISAVATRPHHWR